MPPGQRLSYHIEKMIDPKLMEKTINLRLTLSEESLEALKGMLCGEEDREPDYDTGFDDTGDFLEVEDDYDDNYEPEKSFMEEYDGMATLTPGEVEDIRMYTDYLKEAICKLHVTNAQIRNVLRRHRSWSEKCSDIQHLLSDEEASMESAEACVYGIAEKCRPLRETVEKRTA